MTEFSQVSTEWFNGVLKSLTAVENVAQLIDIINNIKQQLGFNSIACGLVIPNNFRHEDYYIYSDDTAELKQRYIKEEYWKIDTRIIAARKQILPFRWSEMSCEVDFISKKFADGFLDGTTIPVHGPHHFFGFLHFTYTTEQEKLTCWLQYIQPFLTCLAQHIVIAKARFIHEEKNKNMTAVAVTLTDQQRKCLVWVAEGKSTEETALILGVSLSTVNKHLESAAKLLNTNSRSHTIAKVVDGKLIGLTYKKKANIYYL